MGGLSVCRRDRPAGTFDTVRLRWTLAPGAAPVTGSLYLLSQEYLGQVNSPVRYLSSQSTSDIYPGGDLYGTSSLSGGLAFIRLYVNTPNERLDASFTLRAVRVQ